MMNPYVVDGWSAETDVAEINLEETWAYRVKNKAFRAAAHLIATKLLLDLNGLSRDRLFEIIVQNFHLVPAYILRNNAFDIKGKKFERVVHTLPMSDFVDYIATAGIKSGY